MQTCWKCSVCLKLIVKICMHYIIKWTLLMSYLCLHVQTPKLQIRLWLYFVIGIYIKSCQAIQIGFVSVKYKPHFMQSSNWTSYTFYQIWIFVQIILTQNQVQSSLKTANFYLEIFVGVCQYLMKCNKSELSCLAWIVVHQGIGLLHAYNLQ